MRYLRRLKWFSIKRAEIFSFQKKPSKCCKFNILRFLNSKIQADFTTVTEHKGEAESAHGRPPPHTHTDMRSLPTPTGQAHMLHRSRCPALLSPDTPGTHYTSGHGRGSTTRPQCPHTQNRKKQQGTPLDTSCKLGTVRRERPAQVHHPQPRRPSTQRAGRHGPGRREPRNGTLTSPVAAPGC